MDKRHYLGSRKYYRKGGTSFDAKIYQKSNNRGMTCRMVYGQMELYVSSYTRMDDLDKFVAKCVNKHPERILNRPFLQEGVYCYVLGKKRYFVIENKVRYDDTFFYLTKAVKDPVHTYKKLFLEYLNERVPLLAKRMGLDVSGWKIQTGLFLSYYGVCFPTKHVLKFDYRLFAYKSEISDAVIYHELTHILDIHHDERFYRIVKMYCPNYDFLEKEIDCGYFEGGLDRYVL